MIDRLVEFARQPAMKSFEREAFDRFLGQGRIPDWKDSGASEDYLLFAHHDGDGKTLIDHFLEQESKQLSEDNIHAIKRFKESMFGFFKVEEVLADNWLNLRHPGTAGSFAVSQPNGTRSLKVGMGFFTRLLPYQDHFTIAGMVTPLPEEITYLVERMARRHGEKAMAEIADPIRVHQLLKSSRQDPSPPENQLEAELFAASVFAEVNFPFTVDELQKRFQEISSPLDVIRNLDSGSLKIKSKTEGDKKIHTVRELNRLMAAIQHLWNHTPRDEFNGLTPAEKQSEGQKLGRPVLPQHLARDLLDEAISRLKPEDYRSEQDTKRALNKLKNEWFQNPQAELGGLSPAQAIDPHGSPPLPQREEDLPLPNLPHWPENTFHQLLSSRSNAAVSWALKSLAERTGSALLESLASFLDDPDIEKVDPVLDFLDHHPLQPSEAAELEKIFARNIGRYKEPDEDLWQKVQETFDYLECLSCEAKEDAGSQKSSSYESISRLIAKISSYRHARSAGPFIGRLLSKGDAEAVGLGAAALMKAIAEHSAQECDFCTQNALYFHLDAFEVNQRWLLEIESLFDRREGEPAGEKRPSALWPFLPSGDAAALKRGREVYSVDREQKLLRLIEEQDWGELDALLVEMALEALPRAITENPAFTSLGKKMEAFIRATANPQIFQNLPVSSQRPIAVVHAAILAKAIQGHFIEKELEEWADRKDKLLTLLQINAPWLTAGILKKLGRIFSPSDLQTLLISGDYFVQVNALALQAVISPNDHLDQFIRRSFDEEFDWDTEAYRIIPEVIKAAGDAVLIPLAASLHRSPEWREAAALAQAIQTLKTRRAAIFLERYFESLARLPVQQLAGAVVECGSHELAVGFIDRLRTGCLDLEDVLEDDFIEGELTSQVEIVLLLHEIPGEAQWMVERGKELQELHKKSFEEDRLLERPAERPLPPIRRESPKIGRNDPCPCGSGKKYKKCCGKDS